MNPEFWFAKRVLITGHTGFKGSWLALCLQRLGANVVGFSLPPNTDPNLYELANVADCLQNVQGDILNLSQLQEAITQHQPEIVFHLAAQALVRYGYAEPVETYATNVMGTAHLLESVRHCSCVKAVVVVTSDKCYNNNEWQWGYRENEAMGGYDPYSSSKACAELITDAYRKSYLLGRTHVATARAGNVIGGGDWAQDRLLPDMVKATLAGETVVLRNPKAIRPWQHVLDPITGYLLLAERLYKFGTPFSEAWNFGPSNEDAKPVEFLVQQISALWPDLKWMIDEGQHPHEASHLKLDCSKAHALLGWLPKLRLPQALEWTTTWYRAYQNGADMQKVSMTQIDNYMELLQK